MYTYIPGRSGYRTDPCHSCPRNSWVVMC